MKGFAKTLLLAAAALAALAAPGCGRKGDDRVVVSFWHTQRGTNQEALAKIIAGFNGSQERYRVVAQYVGGYDQIYRKMVVSIRANKPPALVVAYESMVVDYHKAGAVVDLDRYLTDPECGFTAESLADIYPQFIERNRFRRYGNKLLSFPFTKSVLMMYYNKGLLRQLGYERPPETWDEFVSICRAAKEAGKRGYALSVDASTIDAMVYSFGGQLLSDDDSRTLLGGEPARAVYRLIELMMRDRLAYMILEKSDDDRIDLANGRSAFMIRSSTTRPFLEMQVDELKKAGKPSAEWDLAIIPHAPGVAPVTVMFGANICMLKTTPEVQRGAWEFIKHFTSAEVTAEWATKSGYLPVRKSAVETATLREFFAKSPLARTPLEALPYAAGEPTVEGWQQVRSYIEDAERAVVSGTAADAAADVLAGKADRLLAELQSGRELSVPVGFDIGFAVFACGVAGIVWRLRRHLG